MELSERELDRYNRQMMIKGWDVKGQVKLKNARVVVVGSGGLGSPILMYLTAAGIGEIIVVDKGRFELSNLNRQILGWETDVGKAKAVSARWQAWGLFLEKGCLFLPELVLLLEGKSRRP